MFPLQIIINKNDRLEVKGYNRYNFEKNNCDQNKLSRLNVIVSKFV